MSPFLPAPPVGRRICSIVVCGALLISSATARAQATEPSLASLASLRQLSDLEPESAVSDQPKPVPKNAKEREALHVIELGDNAVSEDKHHEAIRFYERALGLVSDTPYWTGVTNDLRRKLATSHERWFRVVGDTEDLRRALVYAEGYLAGLPSDAVKERTHAESRVKRLRTELNLRAPSKKSRPEPEPEPEPEEPATGDLVGNPDEVIAPEPLVLPTKAVLERQRALRAGVIVTGSLGWLGLVGMGSSYFMYSKRYDEYFSLYNRHTADPADVSRSLVNKARRHRDGWRYATLASGGLAAAGFAAATIMLVSLAKSKKKNGAGKKIWAWVQPSRPGLSF